MPRAAPSNPLTHAALMIVVACRFAPRFVAEGGQAFSTKLSCLGRWHSQPWRLSTTRLIVFPTIFSRFLRYTVMHNFGLHLACLKALSL